MTLKLVDLSSGFQWRQIELEKERQDSDCQRCFLHVKLASAGAFLPCNEARGPGQVGAAEDCTP